MSYFFRDFVHHALYHPLNMVNNSAIMECENMTFLENEPKENDKEAPNTAK